MRSANPANAYSHPNSNKTSLVQVLHPALEICRDFPNRRLLKPCSWPCRVSPVFLWVKTGAPGPFTCYSTSKICLNALEEIILN